MDAQSWLANWTDMSFHTKVILISFFARTHLRITFSTFVLGAAGSSNNGGVNQRCSLYELPLVFQMLVSGRKDRVLKTIMFKKVANTEYSRLIASSIRKMIRAKKSLEG